MQFLKHVVVYMQHVWIIKYSSDCMYKHYRNEKADVVWTANPEKSFHWLCRGKKGPPQVITLLMNFDKFLQLIP